MVIALSLLLAAASATPAEASAASIWLLVEEQAGLDGDTLDDFVHQLSSGLARFTGSEVGIELTGPKGCEPRGACLAAWIGSRGGELIALRIFGGPTLIRLDFERIDAKGVSKDRGQIDLPIDPTGWPSQIDAWSARIFADRQRASIALPSAPIEAGPSVAPWVLLGGAAVSTAVGIAFALSSQNARAAALTGPRFADEQEVLRDRVAGHAIAADVLFGTAALAAAGAVVWLLVE